MQEGSILQIHGDEAINRLLPGLPIEFSVQCWYRPLHFCASQFLPAGLQ